MKYSLLAKLVCPQCLTPLKVFLKGSNIIVPDEEITEGQLLCEQNHTFLIRGGIPRFAVHLDSMSVKTCKIFGYEWKRFSDYSVDNLSLFLGQDIKKRCQGKSILDAGSGTGRHLESIARYGEMAIGIDISDACSVAYKRIKNLPNAHVVQADIMQPPFPAGALNLIYSFGVLHHLISPLDGFKRLVNLLATEGEIIVAVYKRTPRKRLLRIPRMITVQLPDGIRIFLSFICALIDYALFIKPYQTLKNISIFSAWLEKITPSHVREYAKFSFRINFADWHDRLSAPVAHMFSEEELRRWFVEVGLSDVKIQSLGSFWVRGYGRKI